MLATGVACSTVERHLGGGGVGLMFTRQDSVNEDRYKYNGEI